MSANAGLHYKGPILCYSTVSNDRWCWWEYWL